jgi:hypothetical protein
MAVELALVCAVQIRCSNTLCKYRNKIVKLSADVSG